MKDKFGYRVEDENEVIIKDGYFYCSTCGGEYPLQMTFPGGIPVYECGDCRKTVAIN